MRRVLDGIYLAAGWLAGMFLVAILVIMLVMSGGRQIGLNIAGADDFAAWSMAALAFLGLAYTFKSGEIIRVGLLIDRFEGRTRRAIELGCLAFGGLIVGYFAFYAVQMTYDSWRFGDMSQGIVAVPIWIPQVGYALGLVILAVAFADEFVHVIAGHHPRYEKPKATTSEEIVERIVEGAM